MRLRECSPADGSAVVRVAVVPGSDGNRPPVFACPAGFAAPARVALVYGRRFGIESRYRPSGECLAVTTRHDVAYRRRRVGVRLLIRSWWVLAEGTTVGEWRWERTLTFAVTPNPTPLRRKPIHRNHARRRRHCGNYWGRVFFRMHAGRMRYFFSQNVAL